MNWQLIQSAPLNEIVLLYRPGHPFKCSVIAPGRYDHDTYVDKPKPYWRSLMCTVEETIDRRYKPTHWMPLPDHPCANDDMTTTQKEMKRQQTIIQYVENLRDSPDDHKDYENSYEAGWTDACNHILNTLAEPTSEEN